MTAVNETVPLKVTPEPGTGGDGAPPPSPATSVIGSPIDPPPRLIDVRDTGVTFSLSGVSDAAARKLLESIHEKRRVRVAAQVAEELALRRTGEERATATLARAREDAAKVTEYVRRKSVLEERLRQLAQVIRIKRHERESEKIAKELERLDEERIETIARLGRERTVRYEAELAEWNTLESERNARLDELKTQLVDLECEERKVRDRASGLMNPWMTRTACGFLIWAGYTVIGATGAAVSSLLADSQKRSLLTDVATSSVHLLNEFRGGMIHPLLLAILSLLGFLASLVAVLVGIDLLMRWFDKRWMKDKPQQQSGYKFPAKAEIGRSTFSKLLMTIPLAYIAGSIIAFIAYGGRVASSRVLLLGESTAVLHTIVGSALSLLSASMFLLYFTNILEPRTRSREKWKASWEIGVVPVVMLVAIILAAVFGSEKRWPWAGITAFMLLGAMALAYGLLYRGIFADIDYAARATTLCALVIEEVRQPPVLETPKRYEQREIERVLSDYRDRRQDLLDFDRERRLWRMLRTSDDRDPSLLATYRLPTRFFFWRVFVWWRFRSQPDFYRVTDLEAASVDTAERQELEQQLRDIDLQLAALPPEATRTRFEECERLLESARTERERAELAHPLRIAMNDERAVTESLDFENGYHVGLSMKRSYDTVTARRDQKMNEARKPRVPRSTRSRIEEVPSGH
jgi:hypothetical protein